MNMWSVHDKTESRDGWSLPPGMADIQVVPAPDQTVSQTCRCRP